MFGTLRYALAIGAAATLMGCSAGATLNPLAGTSDTERAQMASFAAKAQYPADAKPVDSFHGAALLGHDGRTIELSNLSDEPWQNVKVWINGSFVREVASVPAHVTITLHTSEFYDRDGDDMGHAKATPLRVEVQNGDRLFILHTATTAS